jgi:YidC/Oxa1 family membrane protein insertase
MDFLTNPFIVIVLTLYQILGQNLVFAIIVFTLLTRVVTFPLMAVQMRSSKRMQELSPKLTKLREKYKNDREKMAQEQMKLYQEHGINPFAGCLPLLIQMPILFGLYGAIQTALAVTPLQLLDLNHRLLVPDLASVLPMENHFLWLNLGQPDPLYILPILVVATTWLQSKIMAPPTTGDPSDPSAAMARQMTVMMPIMVGLFSLSFASGLSIYWIAANIAGILQYAMMGRVDFGRLLGRKPKEAAMLPADAEDDDVPVIEKPKKAATVVNSTAKNKTSAKRATGSTSAVKPKPKTK